MLIRASSSRPSLHTTSLLSLPCLSGLQRLYLCNTAEKRHLRDDPIQAPASNAKNGICVGLPDSPRPHYGEVPDSDEAIGITGDETLVIANECCSMYLSLVPSKNGFRLRRSEFGTHRRSSCRLVTTDTTDKFARGKYRRQFGWCRSDMEKVNLGSAE